jgi:DNA-binding NarL/FixJ family response regulator
MTARILIIEDEALVAMELRFVLEDLGHEVIGSAADARTARNLVKETDVDLALVDIHLSDGPTGVELGRSLAQEGASPFSI